MSVVNIQCEDTIEHDADYFLRHRNGHFEEVVDPLQPILASMLRLLRKVAVGEMERAEALR